MKNNFLIIFYLILGCISILYGYSWWYYPPDYVTGCRQSGMGGIGYSLPNDENVLLFNPAGLGIKNDRFRKLSSSLGYVYDRYSGLIKQDHNLSFCSQPFNEYTGGFAFQTEYFYQILEDPIYYESFWDPETGQYVIDSSKSDRDFQSNSQYIIGFGGALPFFKKTEHSLGVSLKYFRLFKNTLDISSNSFLIDLGYNGSFFNHIHTGISLFNIPIIESYDSKERPLIPLKLTSSIGFLYPFIKRNDKNIFTTFFETYYSFLTQKEKHLYKRHIGGAGFEFGFNETHYIRHGYRFEFNDGYHELSEFELRAIDVSFGIGLKIRGHIELNFYHAIKSYNEDYFGEFLDRNHRIGLSINAYSMFNQ